MKTLLDEYFNASNSECLNEGLGKPLSVEIVGFDVMPLLHLDDDAGVVDRKSNRKSNGP